LTSIVAQADRVKTGSVNGMNGKPDKDSANLLLIVMSGAKIEKKSGCGGMNVSFAGEYKRT